MLTGITQVGRKINGLEAQLSINNGVAHVKHKAMEPFDVEITRKEEIYSL